MAGGRCRSRCRQPPRGRPEEARQGSEGAPRRRLPCFRSGTQASRVAIIAPFAGSQFMSDVKASMQRLGEQARAASRAMAAADTRARNRALLAILEAIDASRGELAAANEKDLEA